MHCCRMLSIVGDKYSRYPEFADYVSPNKTSNVLLGDNGQGFRFHPLGKVIDSDYQELQLPNPYWEGTHDI